MIGLRVAGGKQFQLSELQVGFIKFFESDR